MSLCCVRDKVTFLSLDPTHFFRFKSQQLDIAKNQPFSSFHSPKNNLFVVVAVVVVAAVVVSYASVTQIKKKKVQERLILRCCC